MSSGGTYISNKFKDGEEYDPVEGYSVNTRDANIPSGASIVRGIYYMWNDRGFTGQGWMHDIEGGPTNIYPGFTSDDDVAILKRFSRNAHHNSNGRSLGNDVIEGFFFNMHKNNIRIFSIFSHHGIRNGNSREILKILMIFKLFQRNATWNVDIPRRWH